MSNKFYLKIEGESKEEILESIEKVKKSLENAVLETEFTEDEEDEFCDGDCENCEGYAEEDDPEDVFEDLGKVIGCLVYYALPISPSLMFKYNEAYMDIRKKYADDKDS